MLLVALMMLAAAATAASANNSIKHSINSTQPQPLNFMESDLLFLSELPLNELLKVRKSIEEIQQTNAISDGSLPATKAETVDEQIESRTNDDSNAKVTFVDDEKMHTSAQPLIDFKHFHR